MRAKTGTMTGIVSLSGYLYTANAHTLAFAIYINKRPETKPKVAWRYASLVDALCDFFLKQEPSDKPSTTKNTAHERVAFQEQTTQAEHVQRHAKKWRHMELVLKRALKGKPIAILYRGDHLILDDQSPNASHVLQALEALNKQYPFAAALEASTAPPKHSARPSLLWIKTSNSDTSRTWTLRDAAS